MKFQALRGWFTGDGEAARVWRAVLAFVTCDAFFSGLVLAYAFSVASVAGVLVFIALQQLATMSGHFCAYNALRTRSAFRVLSVGVLALSLTLLLGGLLPKGWPALLFMAGIGGIARGVSYGARLWLEMHLTKGEIRQSYLSAAEGANVSSKLAAPLIAGLTLLFFDENAQLVFLAAGLCFLPFTVRAVLRPVRATPHPGVLAPIALMRVRAWWKTAPFYFLDGAQHSLRTALFVSGAMVVVGAMSRYSFIEASSSVAAILLLAWSAHRPAPGPSLGRLLLFMGILAAGWLSLIGALRWPILLGPFVAFTALAVPILATQKAALTINGMTAGTGTRESNSLARTLVLTAGRLSMLAACLLLTQATPSPAHAVAAMAIVGLLILPLEYFFAHRLARPVVGAP